ncbi:MAG: autotransporter-associated beta strand repeat-containing protein, partial [Bacteroidales bacterium]|nr:autotransporter-associated beta strand repeat-containing protein [Bacteroidales bacterium]
MKTFLLPRKFARSTRAGFCLAGVAAAALLLGHSAWGASYSWNQTATGKSWSLNTNWTPTAPTGGPSAAGDIVTINTNITGNNTHALFNTGDPGTAAKTVGILNIGDPDGSNPFTFNAGTGGGYLVMNNNGAGAEIHQISAGGTAADTIGAAIQISDAGGLTLFNDNSPGILNINGGVTGTGDLTLKNNSSATTGLKFANGAVNNSGKIINSGTGSGTVLISGVPVGSNVTEIIQSSASSQLSISGGITVNGSGTTLRSTTNTGGANLTIQLTSAIGGTGDLILQNNGSLADGVALTNTTGTGNNNTGRIINNGTGTGNSKITSVIGTNVTGVIQDSTTSGLILTGANTFTNDGVTTFGLTIKRGTVTAQTSANALGAGAVTLGDSAGGSDAASLQAATNTFTYTNPFVLASNTTGTLSVGGSVATTFSGGVTGTNNLTINATTAGAITFSTAAINNAGTITNSGTGIGGAVVTTVGSNVTGIIENSTTSALTVTTLNLRGASLATTLTNALGTKLLTVTNVDTGAGNLILKNNSATNGAIVLTNGANNTGTITNSGTGTGTQTLGVIGGNVTGVTQNSTTSSLTLRAANTYTGGTTISAGTLILGTSGTIDNSSGVNLGT